MEKEFKKEGEPAVEPEVKEPETDEELAEAKALTAKEKELAEQAKLQNEAHKAKIEMELRTKGFADLKAFEEYLKAEKIETDKYCEEKIAEANAQKEVADQTLAEAKAKMARVLQADATVQKRRQEAITAEQSAADIRKECDKWFGGLQSQERYHRQHIIPCRKAIDLARRSIYNFAGDIEAITKIDITPLYNYLGERGKELDLYMDNTQAGIPEGVQKIVTDAEAPYKEIEKGLAELEERMKATAEKIKGGNTDGQ